MDIAQHIGMREYKKEDYGQSLAKAGVGRLLCSFARFRSCTKEISSSAANFLGGDAWYNVTVRNETQYFSDIDFYS